MNIETNDHERWTGRLSAFLDGDLDVEEREEMDLHLAGCGACRRILEELDEVKRRAAALGPVPPHRDLWGGIAATLQAPRPEVPEEARVIALPTATRPDESAAADRAPRERRWFRLSFGQLAAASVVLIAVSSAVGWYAGTTGAVDGVSASVTSSPTSPGPGVIAPVADVVEPPEDLAREVADLEQVLAGAREVLDPNTLRILQRNLSIIERAIDDSQRALSVDPGNDFLAEHLQRVYERKLEYLRDAARIAERAS